MISNMVIYKLTSCSVMQYQVVRLCEENETNYFNSRSFLSWLILFHAYCVGIHIKQNIVQNLWTSLITNKSFTFLILFNTSLYVLTSLICFALFSKSINSVNHFSDKRTYIIFNLQFSIKCTFHHTRICIFLF